MSSSKNLLYQRLIFDFIIALNFDKATLDLFFFIDLFCTLFTYIMSELIWHQPRYELSHHLTLVIYSFDGNKNLLGTENQSKYEIS